MEHVQQLNLSELLKHLPKRTSDAHKGNFGHVLVVGGDFGYPGAPVLAALGALRVGAGLVTLASHKETLSGLNANHPEIMCQTIDDPNALHPLLTKATVIVLGPGLGRTAWSETIYKIVTASALPIVVDADALYFLARSPNKNAQRVLTPHPGEAATLLANTSPPHDEQRLKALHALIDKYAGTIVLKGAGSLVGSVNTAFGICNSGNPGMASGGMGDLLSGVIGGLMAQKLDLDLAAKLGVCIHACAGDRAAADGERGILASDLLPFIKQLCNSVETNQ